MRIFKSLDEVTAVCGEELGASSWLEIDQGRIDLFAEATGDHQWIHVDPERATDGLFGRTIARGYLTLSLLPLFASEIYRFETPGPRLNYGIEKVRFPTPLLVGQRARCTIRLAGLVHLDRGVRVTLSHTVAIEGAAKPACVAETLIMLMD